MSTLHTTRTEARPRVLRSPLRLVLAAAGVVCVGLALAGLVVPGLPTTVFLIAACYLFARSCPWLEERLIRVRPFRPYLRYLDGTRPMPLRARLSALVLMWIAVGTSLALTGWGGRLESWFAMILVGAALAGSVAIFRYRRKARTTA